jgi:diaminobutyrate-2-oxoglutarate transaminase
MPGLRKLDLFQDNESDVRSYCRNFPIVFTAAQGATLIDQSGRTYIDFLAGAGALNYGHNNPVIKRRLIEYLEADGITHSLDLHTGAKHDFIQAFVDVILKPRNLEYKLAFTGPTGTNAVEAALKFARLSTGRHNVIAFTNAYHGMSMGALAISGTKSKRAGAGINMAGTFRVPYDGYLGEDVDTIELLEKMLDDPGSGLDAPAAIVLETVQAEGGLNVASARWVKRVAQLAQKHGAVLIVDDIQTGCGRTGTFFSFENMGVVPDIVCLSKSIGGMGLPMSLVLLRPDLDVLAPGQHNGTFRGNNLAFIAGAAAINFWRDPAFERGVKHTADTIRERLEAIVSRFPGNGAHVRGRGLLIGIGWSDRTIAGRVAQEAFSRGLVIETSGSQGQVLKLLPPITIGRAELEAGLEIIEKSIFTVVGHKPSLNGAHELTAGNVTV